MTREDRAAPARRFMPPLPGACTSDLHFKAAGLLWSWADDRSQNERTGGTDRTPSSH